jgi:hypothetical protein
MSLPQAFECPKLERLFSGPGTNTGSFPFAALEGQDDNEKQVTANAAISPLRATRSGREDKGWRYALRSR